MSRGFSGVCVSSISPRRIPRTTAAASITSSAWVGKMRPTEVCPTRCPLRPTRCKPLETDLGDCRCTTRSTSPTSIPSSREAVATRAGRRPALRAPSISRRETLLMLPWWARMGSSPAASSTLRSTPVANIPVSAPTPSPFRRAARGTAPSPTFSSKRRSLRRSAVRSARRRLLQKTSVVRWESISCDTSGITAGQMELPGRWRKSSVTETTPTSRAFR